MNKLKRKKGLEKQGPFRNMNNYFKNYSLSGWIANLGVVPLFLFAAFLLAPIFFFLALLLFLVILVSETIFMLLYLQSKTLTSILRCKVIFLPIFGPSVKAFLQFTLLYGLFSTATYASAENFITSYQKIILSTGEHRQLKLSKINKYTLSNKDVLTFTPDSALIKGKKKGYSELIVWYKNYKSIFQVYVYSKTKSLELSNHMRALEKIGLKAEFFGDKILVKGVIKELEQLRLLKSLLRKKKLIFLSDVRLERELAKSLIADVYTHFFQNYGPEVHCDILGIDVDCYYLESYSLNKKTKTVLEQRFAINLLKKRNLPKNYQLKLKLLQIQTTNSNERNFGLSQLNFPLKDIFYGNDKAIVENNRFILEKKDIKIKTLATPQTLIRLGKKAKLQLGSEIPYTTHNFQQSNTQWNFAGLKLKIGLDKEQGKFSLKVESELTTPGNTGDILGNKQESHFFINLKEPLIIFDVGMEIQGEKKTGIPLLSSIPLIGIPFRGKAKEKIYKKIIAIAQIEQVK